MLVFPSTNHVGKDTPLEESKTFWYGLSQTIPTYCSTSFQNHSKSLLAFFDRSSKVDTPHSFINLKIFEFSF